MRFFDGVGPQDVLDLRRETAAEVEGRFSLLARERGKIVPGSRRKGKNVWTVYGRTFLATNIVPAALGGAAPPQYVFYIGLGIGAQTEVSTVSQLASPVPISFGTYLKAVGSVDFPNDPVTSAAFIVEFGTTDFAGNPELREAGLFLDDAVPTLGDNNPVAYKNFEPLVKTSQFRLEVRWEIRFR